MILIFSNSEDYNIKSVCEWLLYFNEPFLVILNGKHKLKLVQLELKNNLKFVLQIRGKIVKSEEIKSIWFRNGLIELENYLEYKVSRREINTFENAIKYYLSAQHYSVLEFIILWMTNHINCIGAHKQGRYNKIWALYMANKVGFKIPDTNLCINKHDLNNLLKQYPKILNKSLDVNFEYFSLKENIRWYEYSKLVDNDFLNNIDNNFFASVLQTYIEKKIELRVFYLNGDIFCSAILSQDNPKTVIDYRRYDTDDSNRVIPFKLPKHISFKINKLMKLLKLTTGSIDIIVSSDNQYYFLEVNPVGQYAYNSSACGFSLHKKIAEFLSNKNG